MWWGRPTGGAAAAAIAGRASLAAAVDLVEELAVGGRRSHAGLLETLAIGHELGPAERLVARAAERQAMIAELGIELDEKHAGCGEWRLLAALRLVR